MSMRGSTWLGYITPQQAPNVTQLAVDTANRIAERPSLIVISRYVATLEETIQLAPQQVRIEVVQNARNSTEQRDAIMSINRNYTVLIGLKDHPTIPNTNIRRADMFYFEGRMWEIISVITTVPGRLLAEADMTP